MARQPELHYEQDESSSSEEELEQLEEISEEESDEGELPIPQTPSKRKGKARATEGEEEGQNIIVPTSFDAYFTYTASKVQTSGNVFSEAVLPLSKEEYAEGIKAASKRAVKLTPSILEGDQTKQLFSRFIFELKEGFNLLCYGFRSKRQILNQFAQETCSKHGHVVVANAFKPDFAIRDLLVRIASLPNVIKEPLGLYSAPDKGAEELVKALSKQKHQVYVVIHNIDAPSLRSARAKTALAVLASNPLVHIIASIDHLNAPLLWSSSEVFARKSSAEESSPASTRGFAWLWHDLTTLAPYDAELAFADRSSIVTAAQHILASVTQKAKKLFSLLGKRQLASIEQGVEENKTGSGSGGLREHGMAYGVLFAAARDDFVATNDQTLRALLGEFKDHRLILSEPNSAGVEVLWIPMRKERLQSVLDSLEAGA
ncbi:hypothetical protein NMY22_g7820 [Coprinellus aureogranulatus]|nr:hypothetical protein NMY22_g7820 [Coprinellus aureogranulatus]